jgi:hypothetical protein
VVKQKVREGRGGGGGGGDGGNSEPSDREAKRRKNSKIKGEKERVWATRPRSDHRWSRSGRAAQIKEENGSDGLRCFSVRV